MENSDIHSRSTDLGVFKALLPTSQAHLLPQAGIQVCHMIGDRACKTRPWKELEEPWQTFLQLHPEI